MEITSKMRVTVDDSPAGIKLDSWKEIGAYLSRDPRTVQMWEKSEGFPVHRLNHNSRPSVYAYTFEIDAWVQARTAAKPETEELDGGGESNTAGAQNKFTRLIWYLLLAAVVAAVMAAAVVAVRSRASATRFSNATLAVLPFEDQAATSGSEADSLTDGVIDDLGRMGRFPVISRGSVESAKASQSPLDQIAASLNASLLLQGTVVEANGEIHVTVDLISEPGDVHQWGATYSRRVGNTAAEDIASAVAADVARHIMGSTPAGSTSGVE